MAYCPKCGNEVKEDEKFCSICGEKLKEEINDVEVNYLQNTEEINTTVPKCFTIFGKIGFILGIVTIAICLIPGLNVLALEAGPAGIVFSCLGKKDTSLASKTKVGLILSIVGTVVGFIMYIIYMLMFNLDI